MEKFGSLSRRMFIKFGGIALAGGAVSLVAACSSSPPAAPTAAAQSGAATSGSESKGTAATPAAAKPAENTKATISFGSESNPALEEWVKGPFNGRNPNITVTYQPILGTSEEQRTKILTMAAAKTLPHVLYVQGTRSQMFIANNVYQPLDPFMMADAKFQAAGGIDDFYSEGIRPYQRGGKTYCLPYDFGPACMVYYKPLFEKASIPFPTNDWSFEKEFLEAATAMSKPGETWFTTNLPAGNWTFEGTYLRPWGGRLTNDDETEMLITSDESQAALSFWKELNDKKLAVSIAERKQFDLNPFLTTKVGTWWDGAWCTDTINNGNPAMVGKYDVVFMPKGPKGHATAAMGSGYGICTNVSFTDQAWTFLREFTNEGMEEYFAKRNRSAHARKSRAHLALEIPNLPPNAKAWIDANDHAHMGQPISVVGPELQDLVTRELELLFVGNKSVKEATEAIKRDGDKLVAKNRS